LKREKARRGRHAVVPIAPRADILIDGSVSSRCILLGSFLCGREGGVVRAVRRYPGFSSENAVPFWIRVCDIETFWHQFLQGLRYHQLIEC
jgi:hypothetical protein